MKPVPPKPRHHPSPRCCSPPSPLRPTSTLAVPAPPPAQIPHRLHARRTRSSPSNPLTSPRSSTSWQTSPQAKAWLASDDYAVFQNSGLFTPPRLLPGGVRANPPASPVATRPSSTRSPEPNPSSPGTTCASSSSSTSPACPPPRPNARSAAPVPRPASSAATPATPTSIIRTTTSEAAARTVAFAQVSHPCRRPPRPRHPRRPHRQRPHPHRPPQPLLTRPR